jgi:hypothetical protein
LIDKVIDEEYFKNKKLIELASKQTTTDNEKVSKMITEKKLARFAELQKQEVVLIKRDF